MLEFCNISSSDIESGNYPLNHDCLIKVFYRSIGINNVCEFFSCPSQYSGEIVGILKSLFCVTKVFVISTDEYNESWLMSI